MIFNVTNITDGQPIPDQFAFCVPDPIDHATFGQNLNPAVAWRELPPGTRSVALICHDPDVPSDGTHVNKEGEVVPADLARVDFFHWVVVDIPLAVDAIGEGQLSQGVTARGKDAWRTSFGARQGINNYTDWFAGDADMAGDYVGYDGPCPPWNDALVHRYHFTLYALDVDRLVDLDDRFTGPQALAAIKGHVIAQARVTGTYTLNPALR